MKSSFHLAFPIKNLQNTKEFYVDLLGCSIGRESSNWMDFNFFGHQLTAQVNPDAVCSFPFYRSEKNAFPFYHFGAVLTWKDWHEMEAKLSESKIRFLIEPKIVFSGEVGEQKTMFVEDPNGYAIEFKAFEQDDQLFKST
ncbi:MAG: VOC family protein [Crocinitomicaceae bacterium]|nr:VOC family protein [Crocinitomicaceae bacterium]